MGRKYTVKLNNRYDYEFDAADVAMAFAVTAHKHAQLDDTVTIEIARVPAPEGHKVEEEIGTTPWVPEGTEVQE